MRVVSLLAHDHPDSAALSIHNISWAVRPDVFIVHWSGSATEDSQRLIDAIAVHKYPCVVKVNPKSIVTSFANILDAHILNVELALELGATPESNIIMHASNDWYVRDVYEHLDQHAYIFQLRHLTEKSNHQFAEGSFAANLQSVYGQCVYSQPEGTSYPASVFMLAKVALQEGLDSFVGMAAEELLLPSIALSVGIRPTATPAIFSEVIRGDIYAIRYWNYFARFGLLKFVSLRIFLRRVSVKLSVITMACSPSLGVVFSSNSQTIRRIRTSEIFSIFKTGTVSKCGVINENGASWTAYLENSIYGIKRLPRDPKNEYRLKILDFIHALSR